VLRRRHHGRGIAYQSRRQGHADHHEGHPLRGAGPRHERGRQAALEARSRRASSKPEAIERHAGADPPDAELRDFKESTSSSRPSSRTRRSRRRCSPRSRPGARRHDHRVEHLDDLDQLPRRGPEAPQNFVGMHFFNPVHMMPLVEVIRGKQSSDEAVAATVKLSQKMGRHRSSVNDCPGFFVNACCSRTSPASTCCCATAPLHGRRQAMEKFRLADGPPT